MRTSVVAAALAVAVCLPVAAQEGPRVADRVLHSGGHPAQGTVMSSAAYRVTLDSVGEPWAGLVLAAAGYRMQGAFVAGYAPPSEVADVRFADPVTLAWAPERSVGTYRLYRGSVAQLASGDYGSCTQADLAVESALDLDTPLSGQGFTYLVTATNRLEEEGSPGTDSAGTVREPSSPCP